MGNDISYHGKKFFGVGNGISIFRQEFPISGNSKWEIQR